MAASIHRLPPELLDIVLNLVAGGGRWSLLACTSVCSQWRAQVLPILLGTIRFKLDPRKDTKADRIKHLPGVQAGCLETFLVVLNRYPGLGNSIFTVEFVFGSKKAVMEKSFFLTLLDILPTRCKRIRTLEIRFADAGRAWRVAELRTKLREFTEVDTLKLRGCGLRASDLRAFSAALPRLKHLDIGSRFVVDSRQSSGDTRSGRAAKEECRARSLSIVSMDQSANPAPLCDFLREGPFRHVSVLSVSFPSEAASAMRYFAPYIASLGPVLKHLEVWGPARVSYPVHLPLDISTNSSLQSLVLGFDAVQATALMKSQKHASLRRIMWQVSELSEEDLKAELTTWRESLPAHVQQLCVFDPPADAMKRLARERGRGLRRSWEATVQEVFTPMSLRGVTIRTLALASMSWPRDTEAHMLARDWGRKVAAEGP